MRNVVISFIGQDAEGYWLPDTDGIRRIKIEPGSDMNNAGKLLAAMRLAGADIRLSSITAEGDSGIIEIKEKA